MREQQLGLPALVRAEEALASDLQRLIGQRVGLPPAPVEDWLRRDRESRALTDDQQRRGEARR